MKQNFRFILVAVGVFVVILVFIWLLDGEVVSTIQAQAGTGVVRVAPVGTDVLGCGSIVSSCASVQYAVDTADEGDNILIASGLYTGVNGYNGTNQMVYLSKTLTIRGGYSADFSEWNPEVFVTVLDAQGGGCVLRIVGTISSTIEALRITGGRESTPGFGGGVNVVSATVVLVGNTIDSNYAPDGYGGGGPLSDSNATFVGNAILSNTVSLVGGSDGGGVFLSDSNAVFVNNVISFNRCFVMCSGGGLFVENSNVMITGNIIMSNTAGGGGGGLYVSYGSRLTLTNNLIAGNQGGGLWFKGVYNYPVLGDLIHNTIVDNHGDQGVHADHYATLMFTDTIISGHSVGISVTADSTVTLEATLWYSNSINVGGDGSVSTGTINIYDDPAFVGGGDYHLDVGSAAIDSGVDAGITTDIDGDLRPFGFGYDIGIDEYQLCFPLSSVTITGPITGVIRSTYVFTATTAPPTATHPITYTWSPGPTSGQGTGNADYSWSATGTHTVTVTAINCGGFLVSDTHSILVGELPTYTLSVDVDPLGSGSVSLDPDHAFYDEGVTVTMTAVPTDTTWQFDRWTGDVISGSVNPTETIIMSDNYAITAVFSELAVCTEIASATLSYTNTGTIYTGDIAYFQADLTPAEADPDYHYIVTLDGEVGEAMSSSAEPLAFQHTFDTTGIHTVEIAVWNCEMTLPNLVTATLDIAVYEPPPPCIGLSSVSITGTTIVVVGNVLTLTAAAVPPTATQPITYIWLPEPASGQGTANAGYSWEGISMHTAVVTAANQCETVVTATHVVEVRPHSLYLPLVLKDWLAPCTNPVTDISISGPATVAAGEVARFEASHEPNNALPPTYIWNATCQAAAEGQQINYVWDEFGTMLVTATGTGCGGVVTSTHSIEVQPRPLVGVEDAPDFCPGLAVDVWQGYRENFDHQYDRDLWRFSAEANVTYTIRLNDLESRADTVLYLYADCADYPDNYIVMNDDCIQNEPSSGSCITWQAPAVGVYHIFSRGYDYNTYGLDTGYTLTIERYCE